MWILVPALALATAIAAHAALCRLPLRVNSVGRFFIAGGSIGVLLCVALLRSTGFTIEALAGIAAYAAACEVYLFLFTLVSGSISVSLATRLLKGPMSQAEIEASIGGRSMVERRIGRMIATGLLVRPADGSYTKTARGALLLWGYRWLRSFFWRPPLIPGIVALREPGPLPDSDAPFYLGVIAFCFFVVLTKTGYDLMFYAFRGIDFIHARVVIVGQLPYCALVALFFAGLLRSCDGERDAGRRSLWLALVFAVVWLAATELLAAHYEDRYRTIRWAGEGIKLNVGAAQRILLSAATFAALMLAARPGRRFAATAVYALGLLMAGQALLFAKQELTGSHMRTPKAFAEHVRLLAAAGDFQGPSKASLAEIGARLERERYRTSVICDPKVTAINCSPHVAHFWNLRMVDGYLNAVPARLPLLPWDPSVIGPRTINFKSAEELPWPLLGLLNVKYALILNEALMKNHVTGPDGESRAARLEDFRILENGSRVVPRVFFARSALGVPGAREDAQKLFPYASTPFLPADVQAQTYAEGLDGSMTSPAPGPVAARFSGDSLELTFEKSAATRFLVVNERFHPRWKAWVDGAQTRIYPANIFMRGVVVPAGASRVEMRYQPFIYTGAAIACYAASLAAFVLVLWILLRLRTRRPAQASSTSA